jgi:hypothetical protein
LSGLQVTFKTCANMYRNTIVLQEHKHTYVHKIIIKGQLTSSVTLAPF